MCIIPNLAAAQSPHVAGRAQHLAEGGTRAARLPRLPSAYRLFAGRGTRYADGESYCDRPAPAKTWRAALSAWPAADRAHFQADQGGTRPSCPASNLSDR